MDRVPASFLVISPMGGSEESIGVYSNIYFPCRWAPFWRRRIMDPCAKRYLECDCIASCGILEDKKLEIVLDVKGCNFSCKLCWGYKLRYEARPIVKSIRDVLANIVCRCDKVRFLKRLGFRIYAIRFTGNEPSLQWFHVIGVIREVAKLGIFKKAIIETNGVLFAEDKELVKELDSVRGILVDIDVSFKGVNPRQFKYLSEMPEEYFYKQIEGFINLYEYVKNRGLSNIRVNPVLGINHEPRYFYKGRILAVEIIYPWGEKMNFYDYDEVFKREVLSRANLRYDEAPFREYYGINKERARELVATIYKGRRYLHKLPSDVIG
ncbi:MAG: radical SAM protein [Candidatus Njordarchaeales archaeon]